MPARRLPAASGGGLLRGPAGFGHPRARREIPRAAEARSCPLLLGGRAALGSGGPSAPALRPGWSLRCAAPAPAPEPTPLRSLPRPRH